ncbi:MAG: hypothetical protein R3D66_03480 [Alphaproteobacteria bacterium]
MITGFTPSPSGRRQQKKRVSESGNVLFYILIAVALLAALSYAVTRGGRSGTDNLNAERARLSASELIDFSNALSTAVAQLRLRGVKPDELCFDHSGWGGANYNHAGCSDDLHKIFHPSGGGVNWTTAPAEAMDSSASPDNLWHIYGDNEIEQVGTTCAAAACADLILVVDELSLSVCQEINDLLDVTASGAAPPTDTDMGQTRYIGAFGYSATIGDEAGGSALVGKSSACFQRTAGPEYVFYKVLIAR